MDRRKLFSRLAFVVLVFGVVWIAVLVHWWRASHNPSGTDVLLYLALLPLGLIVAAWILVKAVDRARKRKEQAESGEAGDTSTETEPDDPTLRWQLPIVAFDAWLPGGETPTEITEAIAEWDRVELHETYTDSQGTPVFVAEIEDMDPESVGETLPATAHTWSTCVRRNLELARTTATRVLDKHFDALRIPPPENAPLSREKPAVLQIQWLLPASWSDNEREVARTWLTDELATAGWETPELHVSVSAVDSGGDALQHLDELNRRFNQGALSLPQLLLASDSRVDSDTIAEWDAAHRLYGTERPEGRAPSEGASAILVAPAEHPVETLDITAGRLFTRQRAKSVDEPQRLQANTLKELATRATHHSGMPEQPPLQFTGDTDMRNSRIAEGLFLAETLAPEQDAETSLLPAGTLNGDPGAVLQLATAVLALHIAADTEQACLALFHHDPSLRAVLQVTPAQTETTDEGETTT